MNRCEKKRESVRQRELLGMSLEAVWETVWGWRWSGGTEGEKGREKFLWISVN